MLRRCGKNGDEGMVLWVGTVRPSKATVESVLVPPQNPIRSEDGVGYFITGETLREVNMYLSKNRLRLIAQVHSHPTEAYHSETDDRYAIVTAEGGISIVVPDFARDPLRLPRCAVYRLTHSIWQPLSNQQIERLLVVIA